MEIFDQYLLDQKLIEACIEGDLDQVKSLFGDANPYALSENGKYCLLEAALFGRIEVVEWLLDNNINPNIIGEDGYPLISLAVCSGNKKLVKRLLKRGIEFRKHLKKKWYSPLTCAERHPEIKKILEKYINKKDVKSLCELAGLAYLQQNELEIDKDIDAQKISEPAQEILKEICCSKLWEQANGDFNPVDIEEAPTDLCSSMSIQCFSTDKKYCLAKRNAHGYLYDSSSRPFNLIVELKLAKDWDYGKCDDILAAAINMNKKVALTGYKYGNVCLWDLSEKRPTYITLPQISNQDVNEIILTDDGNIALIKYDQDMVIWDLLGDPKIVKILNSSFISSYSSDFRYISIFEVPTKQRTLWNLPKIKKVKNLDGLIIFAPSNRYGLVTHGNYVDILDFTQDFVSNVDTIKMNDKIYSAHIFSIDSRDFALICLKNIYANQRQNSVLYLLDLDTLELKLLYQNAEKSETLVSAYINKDNMLITVWTNNWSRKKIKRSCDMSYLSPKTMDLKKAIKQIAAIKVNEEATD